jgi:hypothetical protein
MGGYEDQRNARSLAEEVQRLNVTGVVAAAAWSKVMPAERARLLS